MLSRSSSQQSCGPCTDSHDSDDVIRGKVLGPSHGPHKFTVCSNQPRQMISRPTLTLGVRRVSVWVEVSPSQPSQAFSSPDPPQALYLLLPAGVSTLVLEMARWQVSGLRGDCPNSPTLPPPPLLGEQSDNTKQVGELDSNKTSCTKWAVPALVAGLKGLVWDLCAGTGRDRGLPWATHLASLGIRFLVGTGAGRPVHLFGISTESLRHSA